MEKQKQWAEKLIEVCQLLNDGALGPDVPIPLQVSVDITRSHAKGEQDGRGGGRKQHREKE